MAVPLVHIIILNFNGQQWLPACFEALFATNYENYCVWLVDNGSTDASLEFTQTQFPQVELIENKTNLGFSAGNNVGIERALAAGAEYIVLLNPDTKVTPNWLVEIVAVGERELEVGILGVVQYRYEDESFNAWTRAAVAAHLTELGQNVARPWLPLDWVEGSCFAVKREVFQHIGMLDPLYFSFYEEIDFCRRAACAGYRTALVTNSRVHHQRGGNWSQRNRQRDYLCDRGQFLYALTDPRRTLPANLMWWLITFGSKLKESLRLLDAGKLASLLQIQAFLLTHGTMVYQKWKREQLLMR